MSDLHVDVGPWRMHPLEINRQRVYVSGRVYYRADGGEMFEPVRVGLTNGEARVLMAWREGPSRPMVPA